MVERPLSMREVPGSMPGFSTLFSTAFFWTEMKDETNSNDFLVLPTWVHPRFDQFKLLKLDLHHYV